LTDWASPDGNFKLAFFAPGAAADLLAELPEESDAILEEMEPEETEIPANISLYDARWAFSELFSIAPSRDVYTLMDYENSKKGESAEGSLGGLSLALHS